MGIAEATLISQMNRLIRERKAVEKKAEKEPGQPSSTLPMSSIEQMLMQLIIRCGEETAFDHVEDENGNTHSLTVAQFISRNLDTDGLAFSNPILNRILEEAVAHSHQEGFKAERYFTNHDNIEISRLATQLSQDNFHLADSQQPRQDAEALRQRAIHLVLDFRMDYVEQRLKDIKREIASITGDAGRIQSLMQEFKDKSELRNALAQKLGNNIMV
ncbi:MAG: DNA primase, partial [Proteobacteria bacterium]|nr:DNA primase [Pseudomonadota bacterium]